MCKILLIYPPVAEPYAPYLSLPELSAVLKTTGHEVIQLDLNLIAHHKLLTYEELIRRNGQIRTRFNQLNKKEKLNSCSEQQEYNNLSGPIATTKYLAEHIEYAKDAILNISNYTFDDVGNPKLSLAWQIFDLARHILFFSTALNPYLYEDSISCFLSTERIIFAINNPESSPFYHLYNEEALSLIKKDNPKIIGLSLSFPEQIIPTFLLCSMIKKTFPNTHIVIGGNIISLLISELSASKTQLISLVDSFVVGDGEPAILELAHQLENGNEDLSKVPNLVYVRSNKIVFSKIRTIWDIQKSPPPDFSGLPLDKYFVGKRQLVYMTARGCYYGKCRFCNFSTTKPYYQAKSYDKVVEDLKYLSHKYDCKLFYLADDAIPPERVYSISKKILKKNLEITWWCLTRFDKKGWSLKKLQEIEKAGCYRLFFGGESATDRIQKYVRKGFKPNRIKQVLNLIKKTNLHAHVSMIIGFPTEKEDEARRTVNFLLKYRNWKGFSGRIHIFRLTAYSEFAMNKALKVIPIRAEPDELAVNYPYYNVRGIKFDNLLKQRDKFYKLKEEFDKQMWHLPLNCYPEHHNYEGLQYYVNYRGTIPKIRKNKTKCDLENIAAYIPNWIIWEKYNFNIKALSDKLMFQKKEIEKLEFFKKMSFKNAARKIEKKATCIDRQEIMVMNNIKTGESIFLDSKAEYLINLCNGRNTRQEIINNCNCIYPNDRKEIQELLHVLIKKKFMLFSDKK